MQLIVPLVYNTIHLDIEDYKTMYSEYYCYVILIDRICMKNNTTDIQNYIIPNNPLIFYFGNSLFIITKRVVFRSA